MESLKDQSLQIWLGSIKEPLKGFKDATKPDGKTYSPGEQLSLTRKYWEIQYNDLRESGLSSEEVIDVFNAARKRAEESEQRR